MASASTHGRDVPAWLEGWTEDEIVEDEIVASGFTLRRAGLSAIDRSGFEVSGAAAELAGSTDPLPRARFELFERAATIDALNARRPSLEARSPDGHRVGWAECGRGLSRDRRAGDVATRPLERRRAPRRSRARGRAGRVRAGRARPRAPRLVRRDHARADRALGLRGRPRKRDRSRLSRGALPASVTVGVRRLARGGRHLRLPLVARSAAGVGVRRPRLDARRARRGRAREPPAARVPDG